MRTKRFNSALLSTLIIVSLMVPVITLLSVGSASASPGPDENIARAKDTAHNINQVGPSPWVEYEEGSRPLAIVAKRVGSGGVFAGPASTCRNGRWNDPDNPFPYYDILLDVTFQWMTGLEASQMTVLWYEGHNVYNNSSESSQLITALEALGYTVVPDSTQSITSSLLAPYDIFIVPQMQEPLGGSGTGGDPTRIDNAEVAAIRGFVEGGGGLAIMEASDFLGHNYNKVQNKILAGLDFDYYFQDDQVSDETNNYGGAVYQIVADIDTTTEIGAAYQAATGETQIGLYSTCSLALATQSISLYVLPDYQVGTPGATLEYRVNVSNPTNPVTQDATYTLSADDTKSWNLTFENTSLFVPVGEYRYTTLSVVIPAGTTLGTEDTITVTASASGYPEVQAIKNCVAHAGLRIEPTDDTYVSTQESGTNYNSENRLRIGSYYEYWQWDYLQFDLSEIPSDKDVTDARLYLFAYYKYSVGFDVRCSKVDDDLWTETSITWNNKPTPGAVLDTKNVDAAFLDSPKSYSWDVTSFVQQEFAGDKKASFCMLPPDSLGESISRAFWAKERYENRTHPFLRIIYGEPPPGVSVSISPGSQENIPGGSLVYEVTVTNTGPATDIYDLEVTDNAAPSWGLTLSGNLLEDVGPHEDRIVTLSVTIPGGAENCTRDSITVTATSSENAEIEDSASCVAHCVVVSVAPSPPAEGVSPLVYVGVAVVIVVIIVAVLIRRSS